MDLDIIDTIAFKIQRSIVGLCASGEYGRREHKINELEFITKRDLNDVLEEFTIYSEITQVHIEDDEHFIINTVCPFMFSNRITDQDRKERNIKITIWFAGDDYEYFFRKLMIGMTKEQNLYWKEKAKEKGYELSDKELKQIIDGKEYLLGITSKRKLKKLFDIK